MCSPTSDGSAAAIVCSEDFVKRNGLQEQAVEILAMEITTDLPSTFNEDSCTKMVLLFQTPWTRLRGWSQVTLSSFQRGGLE